jgi:hypothetical protein
MTTFNVRCTIRRRCGKAFTLRHHPDQYKIYPKCPACGVGFLNEIPYAKIQTQERTCRCDGIFYPHKKGLFLSKDEFCEHAEVDLDFEGSSIHTMKPTDDCPF